MDIYINGVRDSDGKLSDMVDLKEQCDKLKIEYPQELVEYFKGTDVLEMESRQSIITEATEVSLEYDLNIKGLMIGDVEYGDGAIIDLSKIPDDIKKLRIYAE